MCWCWNQNQIFPILLGFKNSSNNAGSNVHIIQIQLRFPPHHGSKFEEFQELFVKVNIQQPDKLLNWSSHYDIFHGARDSCVN
jgi:hypothetical protein